MMRGHVAPEEQSGCLCMCTLLPSLSSNFGESRLDIFDRGDRVELNRIIGNTLNRINQHKENHNSFTDE